MSIVTEVGSILDNEHNQNKAILENLRTSVIWFDALLKQGIAKSRQNQIMPLDEQYRIRPQFNVGKTSNT